MITPQTKEMPLVEARGKKVIVKFNEGLKPNTTYRIFFGNAIADMHEGNILGNLEYVFSTGTYIDSLWMKGRVTNAFELLPEKDILIGLYADEESDSVVYKKKPLYIAKTSDNGDYRLSHLPSSSFKMFAFSDKNKNLMYDGGDEAIAFKDSSAHVGKDTITDLKLFREIPSKRYIKKITSPQYGLTYIVYNKPVSNELYPVDETQRKKIYSLKEFNDTCRVYYYDIYDTLRLYVKHSSGEADTIKIPLPSKERFDKQKKENKIRLSVELPDEAGKIPYYKKPALQFLNWIDFASTDTNLVQLYSKTDTLVSRDPLFEQESVNSIRINAKLQAETQYYLDLKKGALKSKSGILSDSMQLSFRTSSPDDYATLRAKLLLPRKEMYIVQLLNDKKNVVTETYVSLSITSSAEQVFVFKNLLPGNYFMKVIEDKNGNKTWDTGDLMQKQQPETIYFNLQPVKIPAGWDSEIEWNVN